jgi:cellulose synthase/poly-beta-1,6-N-acetylglucosamine synthase-like glycosyltransferase
MLLTVFALAVTWRGVATGIARRPSRVARMPDAALPSYTVIVPLYREAPMVPGIVAALAALDYPKDRLQILFALETGDQETFIALRRARTSGAFDILVAPPGGPKTKPRACSLALREASGAYVVVYDAEDRPHPLQLREAAARFAAGGARLACLQAPLRIAPAPGFFPRQFALEYAAQFEIILPALARLGAPFPLGGTSNHFRASTLAALGGWDAWNVTEDADLGFRLAAQGYAMGILRTPTWESAPTSFRDWLPQRSRWVKGYMQTWGVHTRSPLKGGLRRAVTLQATLGLAILSAFAHGPVLLACIAETLIEFSEHRATSVPAVDLALLVSGWGGAILAMSSGAKQAGRHMTLWDGALAPVYWALQSLAALQAAGQLCTRPHHWNKTSHEPQISRRIGGGLDETREASVRRVA